MKFETCFVLICQLLNLVAVNCENEFGKCGEITASPEQISLNYEVGVWPWMGSFGFWSEDGQWNHQCGTTLISETHFITAAHCVDMMEKSWVIRHGVANLTQPPTDGQTISIEKFFQHPKYTGTAYYDIAVLQISPIEFKPHLRPICLPNPTDFKIDKYDDKTVTLIGWGNKDALDTTLPTIKRTILTIYDNSFCNTTHLNVADDIKKIVQTYLPELFQPNLLCAGYESSEQGSCKGDSGGPIMFYKTASSQYFQVGLVSGGISKCSDKNIPPYFTRLDHPEIAAFISSPELSYTQSAIVNEASLDRGNRHASRWLRNTDDNQCGRSISDADVNFVSGSCNNAETNPVGQWPWMASLGFYDDTNKWQHQCGATLITKMHFLTAAHCVSSQFKIRLGDSNHESKNDDRNAVDLEIIKTISHPKYNGEAAYYDVAILVTEEVTFSRAIGPICLPDSPSDDNDEYKNDHVQLVGWGASELHSSVSQKLKRVELKIFPISFCNKTHSQSTLSTRVKIAEKLPQLFQSHIMCAGSTIGSQGSCKGDGGSPLMYQDLEQNGQWIQIATVAGAIRDCGDQDYPGLYIRLDDPSIFNFIRSAINNSNK